MNFRWPISAKYIGATALIVLAGLAYWLYEHPMVTCHRVEHSIGGNSEGKEVSLVEDLCDGIASSDMVSIEISKPSHAPSTVFKFDAAYSFVKNSNEASPHIEWTDPATLKISVGKVYYVYTQERRIDNINIVYDIGAVMRK